MSIYLDLAAKLPEGIVAGEIPPGASLPSIRSLPRPRERRRPLVGRAHKLAEARAIVIESHRGRVTPRGVMAARAILRGGRHSAWPEATIRR